MYTAQTIINLICKYSATDEMSELVDTLSKQRGQTFGHGTGANKTNLIFHDQRDLEKGANETLDIHGGGLTNKVGETITMDILRALYIKNNTDDSSIEVGGAAVTPLGLFKDATDILVIPPGGEILFIAPDASGIDCSTNSDLKIARTNEGDDPTEKAYDIIIIGEDTPA